MAEPTALVIGATGQVGRLAARAFAARGWRVVGTGCTRAGAEGEGALRRLDLADHAALRPLVREVRPQACLLAAGMAWVDGCEADPARAHAVNAAAPGILAEACREVGAPLAFLSTEYVFDGEGGPYGEDDPPHPVSVYGESKLAGERAVLASGPDHLVVRTTVVYGWHPGDKNFVMQLFDRLSRGEPMRVPVDQRSSPTYAPDLAEALVALTGQARGILNVAGPDVVGRADFARAAARALGLDERLIVPVTTAELGQPARRPLRAGLRVERLRALGVAVRGVADGLDAVAAARRRAAGT